MTNRTSAEVGRKRASPAKRGRPLAGSSSLSRTAIVKVAFEVIESEGVDALSFRAVAKRLGVDAKSLYNHIEDKEALLNAVAEEVLSRMKIPPPTGDLRSDLLAIARSFRTSALSPKGDAVVLLLSRPIELLANTAPLEATLSMLIKAGAQPQWAVHVVRSVLAYITGALLREARTSITYGVHDPAVASSREGALTGLGLPHIALAAPFLSRIDHEAEFEFGLDVLVDAIARKLSCTDR